MYTFKDLPKRIKATEVLQQLKDFKINHALSQGDISNTEQHASSFCKPELRFYL